MPERRTDSTRGPVLLWLEDTADRTAAGAHLRGTLRRLAVAGVRPHRVLTVQSTATAPPTAWRRMGRLVSVIARGVGAARPEVLLARWHPLVLPVMLAWRLRGGRVVLCVQGNLADLHDAHPWTRRVPAVAAMARSALARADAVITPTDGLAAWVRPYLREGTEVTVIPNGVDLDGFGGRGAGGEPEPPGGPGAGSPTGTGRYGVFVGNLARWQGVDILLAATREPAWPAGLTLRVIGDGARSPAVAAAVGERVHWCGALPRAEVTAHVRAAFVAFATRTDSPASATGVAPFKVIEAAAAGVPLIATAVPGQQQLATDLGGAILVPPGDPAAIAGAVATLVQDPARWRELSHTGRRRAAQYDWRHGADALARCLQLAPPVPGRQAIPDARDRGARDRRRRSATSRPPITVLQSLSAPTGTSQYVDQLAGGAPPELRLRYFSWRVALFGRYDAFHVHWPEFMVRSRLPVLQIVRSALFSLLLLRLQITATPVVRTMHNPRPHERCASRLEAALVGWCDRLTGLRIRLNPTTDIGDSPTVTIPLGHYRDYFATTTTSQPVRGRLLYIGLIRPYKGVDELLAALAGAGSPSGLRVVGRPHTPAVRRTVEQACQQDERITCELAYVDDATLVREVTEAELVVLPYRELHNSAMALVALSLDRPILVPRTPSTEVLRREAGDDWVLLYQPPLDAPTLDAALARTAARQAAPSVRSLSERPRLVDRGWRSIGESHYRAYLHATGRSVEQVRRAA